MKKNSLAILLCGIGSVIGCSGNNNKYYHGQVRKETPAHEYEFRSFGELKIRGSPIQIRMSDIDGDGDLDIIVGTENATLTIYENNFRGKR